jgi:cell division protein FtsI (penicillin-binding protein 3)
MSDPRDPPKPGATTGAPPTEDEALAARASDGSDAPDPFTPAHRFGGGRREPPLPRMEQVRVTAPDLAHRAALERTRGRLVLAAAGFAVLFGLVVIKLADATIVDPVQPKPVAAERRPDPLPKAAGDAGAAMIPAALDTSIHANRAMITDRNGEILAVSLPTAGLFANPRELTDPADIARKLKAVLPRIDEAQVLERLSDTSRQFVYLVRQITPKEELQINGLGVPGVYFQPTERRHYPLGRVAAQVLGGVDVDEHGVGGGVEKLFDQRLREDPSPLRLSLDVRVQAVVREELVSAMTEFQAIGACGIVMDVRTGEVLAMVSLPDYDANDFGHADPDEQANRAVGRVYEPGSTFKLQTVSMALDDGVVNIWNGFDASHAIQIGHHTISDFEGKHRWLYVPEIIAYSSNIGAARMAEAVGAERQRAWMQRMGMLSRVPIELSTAAPLAPPEKNWKEAATLTIGFGHGIAVTPLHVVAGTAAVANGGILLRPTILAADDGAAPRTGVRVMQQGTSDIVRKLMRLVVTDGFGQKAEVPGYYVGGKTGTAEKIVGRGYNHHSRVSAFMGVFPMNAPRYAVYMMLDEPKADASTHGYATAGWVSAPAAGRVIARAAPMLGLLPDLENAAAIKAALAIPLQPSRPGGSRPGAPQAAAPPVAHAAPAPVRPPVVTAPTATLPPPTARPVAPILQDLRHEARYPTPVEVASAHAEP